MQTTSHFIGIELKTELFSDIFIKVFDYIKENNIEDSVSFQNPLSPHITLYYLEKDIKQETKNEIKKYIKDFNINQNIKLNGFDYFPRGKHNKFILYFTSKIDLDLESYRNKLHKKYNRNHVEDNNLKFSPHITFLRIQDSQVFEKHRENLENIISREINNIHNLDINTGKLYLYAVNSSFKEEIQIKL